MDPQALNRSRDLLLGSTHPLLVTHVAPDGDALGSLLGLGWMLRSLGREPMLACSDALPRQLDFLPGFDEVTVQPTGCFDLLVSLDCSDPQRMGAAGNLPEVEGLPLLNIDHHVTNLRFGTVNVVDAAAVSTTQILYRLRPLLGVELDERIATCLLTGLVTDTRGFRTSNVTPEVLRTAAGLMEAGASLARISRSGLDRRPLGAARMWGAALSRMEVADGLAWTTLPFAEQRVLGYDPQGDTGLPNMMVNIEAVQMAAVFTEQQDGRVEVGLRAAPGFDVAGVALSLGGGGHKQAAGCLLPGPLGQAQQRVLEMLRAELARQRAAAGNDGWHPQPG